MVRLLIVCALAAGCGATPFLQVDAQMPNGADAFVMIADASLHADAIALADGATSLDAATLIDGAMTPVDAATHIDAAAPIDARVPVDLALSCATTTCDAHATCDDSSGAPICTCSSGFTGTGASCVACASCNSDQYQSAACTPTTNTMCASCDASCVTCSGSLASDCTTCGAARFLSGGVCSSCSTCSAGTYQSAACTSMSDTSCASCDASCITCSGALATSCTGCGGGQFLAGGACNACSSCAAGTYQSAACTATSDTVCASCDASCTTCSGALASNCTSCGGGKFLAGGMCNACSTCGAGTYQSAACTATSDTACASCDASCTTCSGALASNCTSCGISKYLSGGFCNACSTCSAGTYQSAACTITTNTACTGCDASCATCSGALASNCTSCGGGKFLAGGVCNACSSCVSGTYQSAACTATTDTMCASCDASCVTCNGALATNCTSCGGGKFLSGGACSACSTCAAGMYQSAACTTTTDTTCAGCDATCATCNGALATNCTSCGGGKFLSGGVCSACSTCAVGTYQSASCTTTTDTACATCPSTCSACSNASTCTTCMSGYVLVSGACVRPSSCLALLTFAPATTSGVYTLNTGGSDFTAYCDMTTDGGGWTLALKASGANSTFAYDAAIWTNNTLLNAGSPDMDNTEAKLEAFNSVPFSQVMVVFEAPTPGGTRETIELGHSANSLFAMFNAGYQETANGRAAWKATITGSSLQTGCNREGFNNNSVGGGSSRVRIGILGDNGSDCTAPASYLGVGGANAPCGGVAVSVGNSATGCAPDNGAVTLPAFAWVFVRGIAPTSCSTIAYNISAGVVGNQAWNGPLGHDFNVNQDISVTALGVFDSNQDGLKVSITAYIYNRATSTAVIGPIVFAAGNTGTLIGSQRFLSVTPTTLAAGFQGSVVVENYGATEENYNLSGSIVSTFWPDDNNGMLTFTGTGRYGATQGAFPGNLDGGPVNRYGGPTFTYQATAVNLCR